MTLAAHATGMGAVFMGSQIGLVVALALALAAFLVVRSREGTQPVLKAAAIAFLLIATFLAIAVDILRHGPVVRADAVVSQFLFDHRRPWLDKLMMAMSALGDGRGRTVTTIILAGYFLWRRLPRKALGLAVVMIVAAVLTPWLKAHFHIARPSMLYSGAEAFSFPSGHATSAAALYGVLAWLVAAGLSGWRKAIPWGLAVLIVALTAVSRVYVGAHWFSDVLAGVALGAALATGGVMIAAHAPSVEAERGASPWPIVLAVLLVVGAALGPHAFRKAQKLYAPYLARAALKAVDPGHVGNADGVGLTVPPNE